MREKARILVVDDNPTNLQLMLELLERDYELLIANSGAFALDLMAQHANPDLVLLDLLMPGMDGHRVLEHIRQNPTTRQIPVIIVTASLEAHEETAVLQAGAVDFLHRPINPEVLRARVSVHLELAAYRRQLQAMVREKTQELSVALDEAQSASRAKSAFMAMVSHELRTPLHQIMGLADLVLMKTAEDNTKNRLNVLQDRARHLLGLVDDLLDLTLLEANQLKLSPGEFSLDALLRETLDHHEPFADLKKISLDLERDTIPSGLMLFGDEARIRSVLDHLIENAIKFSEEGKVTLSVSEARHRIGDDVALRFEVRDQGEGLPATFGLACFEPFRQADNSLNRKQGGLGSGLTLAQRLVRRMGGELGYLRNPDRGSTFWFELSLPNSESDTLAAPAVRAAERQRERAMVDALAEALAKNDVGAVHLARNGKSRLAPLLKGEAAAFHQAISDYNLAGALEILRRIHHY